MELVFPQFLSPSPDLNTPNRPYGKYGTYGKWTSVRCIVSLDWMDFCCYFIRHNPSSFPPKTKLCPNYESCLFRWNSRQASLVILVAWEWQLTTFKTSNFRDQWLIQSTMDINKEMPNTKGIFLDVFHDKSWGVRQNNMVPTPFDLRPKTDWLSSFTHDFREDQTLTIRNLAISPISQMGSTMFSQKKVSLKQLSQAAQPCPWRDPTQLGAIKVSYEMHQASQNSLIQGGPPKMCFKSHVNDGKHETCLFKVGGDFDNF